MVTYSRSGYGRSHPRADPGTLLDDVADSAAVLDALGAAEFVTLGWSGGGPVRWHAPRCFPGAAAPRRHLRGLRLEKPKASTGSREWGQENLDEFAAALAGKQMLEEWLGEHGAPTFQAGAEEVAQALGDLASEVDRAALTGDLADYVARAFQYAGRQGVLARR